LNYYGSGDTDGDNNIGWDDYNAMLSNPSDRTDVNGNGVTNAADKTLLYQYLTDAIHYLPAHWDYLQNRIERISWFEKAKAIDPYQFPFQFGAPWYWVCTDYSYQNSKNNSGVENSSGDPRTNPNTRNYVLTDNGRFNIPVYEVETTDLNNDGHCDNSILVGDSTGNIASWYFYNESASGEPRVYPGGPYLNSFANIKRYSYFWSQPFNQYMYDYIPLVNYTFNSSGQVTNITFPNVFGQTAVLYRTLKNVHLYGNKPVDAIVNWVNGVADTSANNTGWPTGVSPSGTLSSRSDSSNQNPNIYTYEHNNYDIKRDWVLVDTSSHGIIDTTLGSRRYVFWYTLNRPPQNIHVQDIEPPVPITTPNGLTLYFTQQDNIPATTATDNSGYWYLKSRTITSNQGTDPNQCNYYEFIKTVKDSLSDYSNNISVATSLVNIVLDPSVWTYVPGTQYLNWPASTDPSNTGGVATATNPAGAQVDVTYADNSTQGSDPTQCSYYDWDLSRIFTATTTPCNDQITANQMIYMQAINTPTLTYVPPDTLVPEGGCITPACLGVAQGIDYQTNQPVTPQSHDSITYYAPDSVVFDRHHWVETICGIPSIQGIQTVTEMIGVGIPEKNSKNYFSIYPNPSSGNVNFHYVTTKPEKIEIKVKDITGKKLEDIAVDEKIPGEHNLGYDASKFPAGTYIITFTNSESIVTAKLVKIK
jgi:hypothetical protein